MERGDYSMIDREKVIGAFNRCFCTENVTCPGCYLNGPGFGYECRRALCRDVLELLKEQESVVRCKDCKHYSVEDHYGNFHGYEILAASDVPTCHRWGNDAVMVKPDGYCFLGERR